MKIASQTAARSKKEAFLLISPTLSTYLLKKGKLANARSKRKCRKQEHKRNRGSTEHKLFKTTLLVSINIYRNLCLFCNKPHYFINPFRSVNLVITPFTMLTHYIPLSYI